MATSMWLCRKALLAQRRVSVAAMVTAVGITAIVGPFLALLPDLLE